MTTSTTRLGFSNTYDNARTSLTTRQSNLVALQEQLTSGKKIVRASDDPTGAAQAERSLTRLSRIQADQRGLEAQRNSIAMAESTLGDVADALANFRELVVSAGNATHTAEERKTIAIQLQGLRDQIFALSNRTDTNGLPLFSALGSKLAPFVGPQSTAPDYTFAGLPGQSATSEIAIPFTLDGDSAFMHQPRRDGVYNVSMTTISPIASNTTVPLVQTTRQLTTNNVQVTNPGLVTGASYSVTFNTEVQTTNPDITTLNYDVQDTTTIPSPGPVTQTISYPTDKTTTIALSTEMPGLTLTIQGTPRAGDVITVNTNPSIFSVLDDAIRNIGGAVNRNGATQAVSQALNNIDIGLSRVSAVRGQAGDLLNRADRITANQEKRGIQLESDRSRAEDLDMIKGISDFQNQQTGYQAALQSYAQVQKLSLFNYIT